MPNKHKRNKGTIKNKESLTKRVPRPLGLTLALSEYHQKSINNQEANQALLSIKIRLIEQWTTNGMRLNERIYTLQQISQYLNLPPSIVMKYTWKAMAKMGKVLNYEDHVGITRDLFSNCLFLGTESHALAAQQVSILMRSQGDKYKPFISGSVNQAIGNLIQSQNPLQSLLKLLMEKQELNPLVGTQNNTLHLHVTQSEAMKIINSKQPSMLENPIMADQVLAGVSLPDISPRTQDIKEISRPKLLNPSQPLTHENRREVYEKLEDEDQFIS